MSASEKIALQAQRLATRLRALRPAPGDPSVEPGPPPGPTRPTPPWQRLLRLPRWRDLRAALRQNPGLKLFSLLLAFFLWFSINVSERDAESTFEVPIRVSRLASDLIVTRMPNKPVEVTLRGPRTILNGVKEDRTRLALDLSNGAPGEMRIELNSDMLRPELPRRLKLLRLEPSRLRVQVERLARRRIPVKVDLAGTPPLGYTVAKVEASPSEVEASGPAGKVEDLKEIKTEPLDLRAVSPRFERDVLLSWAGDFVSFMPDRVSVRVALKESELSRKFEHVSVALRNVPEGLAAQLTPPRVDLTVRGPASYLNDYRIPDGRVYVDAAGLAPGSHRVTPHVDLPEPLEVPQREPEVLTLQLTAKGGR